MDATRSVFILLILSLTIPLSFAQSVSTVKQSKGKSYDDSKPAENQQQFTADPDWSEPLETKEAVKKADVISSRVISNKYFSTFFNILVCK